MVNKYSGGQGVVVRDQKRPMVMFNSYYLQTETVEYTSIHTIMQ